MNLALQKKNIIQKITQTKWQKTKNENMWWAGHLPKNFAKVLQKEKFEKSLIEGLATSNRARSLMTEYEQRAEYEARQKITQIQREEGRYKRYEEDLAENLENINNEKIVNLEFKTDKNDAYNYDPATCN